jgi:hypothetical protein
MSMRIFEGGRSGQTGFCTRGLGMPHPNPSPEGEGLFLRGAGMLQAPPLQGRGWGGAVRFGLILPLVTVTGCHHSTGSLGGAPIACQPPGATAMSDTCTVESMKTPDGIVLTIRHPDGSFRRLLQVNDGRGVVAADGAEPATVKAADDKRIDVAIGGARYRLPAKITP